MILAFANGCLLEPATLPSMSTRTTLLRLSAIRIAMALAVAGVGVLFVGATPAAGAPSASVILMGVMAWITSC